MNIVPVSAPPLPEDLSSQVSHLLENLHHLTTSLQTTSALVVPKAPLQAIPVDEVEEPLLRNLVATVQSAVLQTELQTSANNKEKLALFQKIVQVSKTAIALVAKETTLLKNKRLFLEELSVTLRNVHQKTIAVIEEQTKALQESVTQEERTQADRLHILFSARFPGATILPKKTNGGNPAVEVMW